MLDQHFLRGVFDCAAKIGVTLRAVAQSLLLTVFVAGIFFVIHELDTPDGGLTQSEREPLIHLAELLKREAQPRP